MFTCIVFSIPIEKNLFFSNEKCLIAFLLFHTNCISCIQVTFVWSHSQLTFPARRSLPLQSCTSKSWNMMVLQSISLELARIQAVAAKLVACSVWQLCVRTPYRGPVMGLLRPTLLLLIWNEFSIASKNVFSRANRFSCSWWWSILIAIPGICYLLHFHFRGVDSLGWRVCSRML